MTMDPVLGKRGHAAVEPHDPAVAEYFRRHLFEHDPGVRGPVGDTAGAALTEARPA
ncbi:hypothetical protein [Kitasatospora sp. SUK 42]|uniref:hypothetical protein n=1 Tax=Kitasatospora sp. SUK 42 TaxID=1588882 RepID=UPI0018CB2D7A|nr:hypothetical protein [Kitasatospora sp. SUK 42]MBV2152968.1 hypothetical protein [Kitasatospora sp. SUK 42]